MIRRGSQNTSNLKPRAGGRFSQMTLLHCQPGLIMPAPARMAHRSSTPIRPLASLCAHSSIDLRREEVRVEMNILVGWPYKEGRNLAPADLMLYLDTNMFVRKGTLDKRAPTRPGMSEI